MPGIPGTLFDFSMDTADVFQSAVLTGFTITSSPSSPWPAITFRLTFTGPPIGYAFLLADAVFHPPMSFLS
jgi:hypothetical protein